MDKKGKTDIIKIAIIILVVIVAYSFIKTEDPFGMGEAMGITIPAMEGPGGVAGCPDGFNLIDGQCFCNVEDTTITLDAVEQYNVGDTVNDRIYYKTKDDGVWSVLSTVVTDGGTITEAPGTELEVWYALGTAANSNYFSEKVVKTVPCKGAIRLRGDVYQRGNVTLRVFSQDTGDEMVSAAANSTAINETLGAGETPTLKWEAEYSYQNGLPYGGVIVFDVNKTAYDKIIPSLNGATLVEANLPTQHTARGTWSRLNVYEFPALISNQIVVGSIVIDVGDDAADNPTPIENNAIQITIYDYDWVEVDDGSMVKAVEDPDDDSDVGGYNQRWELPVE